MIQRVVIIAVALVALWFGWGWLFPNDEAQIRAVLERIEDAVGGAAGEGGVARIARLASVSREFDPAVTVDAGPGFASITGRDTLIATIGRFKSVGREVEVRFVDVEIAVNPDGDTAQATMTAEAHFSDKGGRSFEARELDVTLRRLDRDWVVSRVALVRTLTPVSP